MTSAGYDPFNDDEPDTTTTPYGDAAHDYAAAGWQPLPLPARKKKDPPAGFTGYRGNAPTPAQIAHWIATAPGSNIGIRMPDGIIGIDIDHYGDKTGGDDIARLEADHGQLPATYTSTSRDDGISGIRFYRVPVGTRLPGSLSTSIEIIQPHHRYAVVWPSIHPEGATYQWTDPADEHLDEAPQIDDLPDLPWSWINALKVERPASIAADPATSTHVAAFVSDTAARVRPQALRGIRTSLENRTKGRHDTLVDRSCQVAREAAAGWYPAGEGFDLLEQWWRSVIDDPRRIESTEFADAIAWAVGQAAADPARVEQLRNESHHSQGIKPPPNVDPVTGEILDRAPMDTRAPRRPDIVHNGRQLDELADQATHALIANNDPPRLFVRSGNLARLREDEDDRPIIESLKADHCRRELAASANWYRVTKEGERTSTSPPLDVSATVLAAGEWDLPALAGVVELPVLRPDGTFAIEHGYDPSTRLYHWHRGTPYQTVPDNPTAAELAAAVALVDEMLCDFPWDSAADRANAWALLLTPLVRAVVGQVPMALVDAPEPGTGKGLLVEITALITIGRAAGLMAWPASDEEMEKKITAALMAGNTMIIWDNVEGMIKSPTLAAVLTAEAWQGRILGQSVMVMVPNRATQVATGNNIDVGGDLARRCYRIRLDAHQAQPWKRTGFRHPDLKPWVTANRQQLLHALCTIVRSWWQAGRPLAESISAMGGYTAWVRNVGGILQHAGVTHFLANLDEFHATADREAQAWEAFLNGWSDNYGEEPMTVAELITKMSDVYVGHKLREVLPEDLSGYWDTPGFSRRLGQALRRRSGRHYGHDGMHLVEMPRDRRQVAIYTVTTRPISLFAAGCEQHPAQSEAVTSTDATDAGSAGSVPSLRHEKSYPQGGNSYTGGPDQNPRNLTTRGSTDLAPDDLF